MMVVIFNMTGISYDNYSAIAIWIIAFPKLL